MKKFLSLILLLTATLTTYAQEFEGKIVFSMTYGDLDPQTQAMMPTESVAYFKNGNSRMEMSMGMGMKNTTITNGKTGSAVVLMDMMGQKIAMKSAPETPESKKQAEDLKVTVTSDTKTIAGYKCTKAIVEVPTKGKESQKMEMWFTKDLKVSNPFGGAGVGGKIDGAVLQTNMAQGPIHITLTAKEVSKQSVTDEKFSVPSDYKEMTQEEMMKQLGGGAK